MAKISTYPLENKIFQKTYGDDNNSEKSNFEKLRELNAYYGKLYLVMEPTVIQSINDLIDGTISPVQRYYLYKELRKQLIGVLHKDVSDIDCPYVKGEISGTLIIENGKSTAASTFAEVQGHYPFVEAYGDGYKALPMFAENKATITNVR